MLEKTERQFENDVHVILRTTRRFYLERDKWCIRTLLQLLNHLILIQENISLFTRV